MTYVVLLLFYLIILAITAAILRFMYKWMNRYLAMKQEQNDLLKELLKKLPGS
jgi:hypothetical protein